MDPRQPQNFREFLRQEVGPNWVLARRSKQIVERYGYDVATLSQGEYKRLEEKYERLTQRSAHGVGPSKALVDAAPHMLAALKQCVAYVDAFANMSVTEFSAAMPVETVAAHWDRVRALIAKATS